MVAIVAGAVVDVMIALRVVLVTVVCVWPGFAITLQKRAAAVIKVMSYKFEDAG